MEKCLAELGCNLCNCAFPEGELDVDVYMRQVAAVQVYYWILHYSSLDWEPDRRLCMVGKCQLCGKLFCRSVDIPANLSGGRLLAEIYGLFFLEVLVRKPELIKFPILRQKYLELFHEQDKPQVEQWLQEMEKMIN